MKNLDGFLKNLKVYIDHEKAVAEAESWKIYSRDCHWFFSCLGLFRWGYSQRSKDLDNRILYLSGIQSELECLIEKAD